MGMSCSDLSTHSWHFSNIRNDPFLLFRFFRFFNTLRNDSDGAEAILLLFIQILQRSELMMERRQGEGDHFTSWDKSQIATSSRLTAIQTNAKVTRVLETLSTTLICRLKEKRTSNACRRGAGYIFVIYLLCPFHLVAIETAISELFSVLILFTLPVCPLPLA